MCRGSSINMFECKRCGNCCGLVPFTNKEYKRIKRKAKKLRITFVKKDYGYITKKASRLMDKLDEKGEEIASNFEQNLTCPFLRFNKDKKAVCLIYEDRPQICRDFGKGTHPYLVCSNNLKDAKDPIWLYGKKRMENSIKEMLKIRYQNEKM